LSLRVVAGELGGRRIEAPPGRLTRPTRDRVREAWFSALGDRVAGARVLDIYAGSGALGIEALSRGAAIVHFVESDRRAIAALRRNLASLGLDPRASVERGDASRVLDRLAAAGTEFDLALADPPYGTGEAARLLRRFRARPFARLLCVEHDPAELADVAARWRRRYGGTMLSFFFADSGGIDDGG
jgi:16S rRNA (guanine966-N2)-methyltransferase